MNFQIWVINSNVSDEPPSQLQKCNLTAHGIAVLVWQTMQCNTISAIQCLFIDINLDRNKATFDALKAFEHLSVIFQGPLY